MDGSVAQRNRKTEFYCHLTFRGDLFPYVPLLQLELLGLLRVGLRLLLGLLGGEEGLGKLGVERVDLAADGIHGAKW